MTIRQNGRHFPDDILKLIFFNENVWLSIEISMKFVPKSQIDNIPALVQKMAWRRPGDKPFYEPVMVSLPTHICVTRPQWVNQLCLVIMNIFARKEPSMVPIVCYESKWQEAWKIDIYKHGTINIGRNIKSQVDWRFQRVLYVKAPIRLIFHPSASTRMHATEHLCNEWLI